MSGITFNPDNPLDRKRTVGAYLLANLTVIFDSKPAPTKSAIPNGSSRFIAVVAFCILTTTALAENNLEQSDAEQGTTAQDDSLRAAPAQPLWEAGLFGFGLTQPAYPGAEDRTGRALPLPYFIYRGKYFRADRGAVGVRALKTPRTELDIGFSGSLGSHSSGIAVRQGMADLGTMLEFGPRLKINLGDTSSGRSNMRLQFPLRAVIDVSHGFISRGITFEPQWVFDKRLPDRWMVSTSLGAIFGDEKLNNTFYGVTANEATPTRPSYTAKSGLIAMRAGMFVAHSLNADVRVFCTLRLESLTGATNRDSPLVRRNSGWAAGVGLAWTLGRSDYKAAD